MSETLIYDRRTIVFHWLTAALIVLLWCLAQTIDWFPNAVRVWPRSAHILTGVLLVLVYVSRITWRRTGGRHLPAAYSGLMNIAARIAHYGLYALVAVTLALGLYYEAIRADNILNLGRLPSIAPGDRALRNLIGDWHGLAANAILILAAVHAAAALYHRYWLKDGVLQRMLGRA